MRIVYPLLWSRLGRQASWEQAAATIAALARQGHEVTALMPRDTRDPALTAADVRDWFAVAGDFQVVQRPSRWTGTPLHRTLLWLRQVFRDPEMRAAEVFYSRIPAMLGIGGRAPIPFATDHYRPWPDTYPAIRPLVRRTARHPNCLGLIVHSDHAARAYRSAGVPDDRLLVAHNGYDPPADRPDKATARARLGLPDQPLALYAGRIDRTKGLDTVIELADRRPDVLFVLVGSEGEGQIEREAARRPNIRVVAWVEPTGLPPWLAAADALLIPPSREPLERFGNCVMPLKLFSYLAAARPILAPFAPDTAELLAHGETAWLVPAGEPEAAAAGLDRLLGDPDLAARLSANSGRLAEGLTWDRRAQRIGQFLEARLSEAPRPRPLR